LTLLDGAEIWLVNKSRLPYLFHILNILSHTLLKRKLFLQVVIVCENALSGKVTAH